MDGQIFSKFHGRGSKIDRINSIRVTKPLNFFNNLRAVACYVTSSWAIVFFALSLHLPLISILGSSAHTQQNGCPQKHEVE